MTKLVIAEFMDEAAVDDLRRDFDVVYDAGLVDDPARLMREISDAAALVVRNRTQVRVALLDAAPNLKALGRLGVGLDNIDLDACAARDIKVLPATGANDVSVAEYVLTSAMMLLRGAYFGADRMMRGDWPREDMCGRELSGKILGLLGYGSVARETAKRARLMGTEVLAHDPFARNFDGATRVDTLAGLLATADIVSLHVPLTDGTRHIIDESALARMKPTAILINAARGGVVDETALTAALKAGTLHGAALDVFETEPMTLESGQAFAGITNLILTPHIAGVTQEANARVSALTADNIRKALG
ncbi:hydroxyacid dehydrogenase [Litoreibacter arenae]|uniref:D-3-phosphoglycerate dehydrogenase n=1 Tax=Litoreibacter arenae DSM 19593 TaxID=1123360 RepID=S9RUD4_9RHOB|nr:hydroxyacid dehydrogenase [Litoreibacter arenae]EPX81625.1 D-3-phosphoglycerate dehydrogenase [Litoreibacter arenae DSM 19593]